jgi:hypothetical protein
MNRLVAVCACVAVALLGCYQGAGAEQYNFVNSLPNYLEIEQGDTIVLKNLTNSTINLRHTSGLFSSGELNTNGTWTGNMPYDAGIYEWEMIVDSSQIPASDGTINIRNSAFLEQNIIVEDNIIQGTLEPGKPIAVTVVSPSYDVTNKVISPDNNGDFETKLNPEEKGEHQIFVTQESRTLSTAYTVEDEFKNLELRLDILKTLKGILEVIFGQ